ncbi:HNH endonuclease [Candidatus Woesearchaeota archaeon]|nr:HNH endonuclease [Candidatus Woesearchaeota archaeon]
MPGSAAPVDLKIKLRKKYKTCRLCKSKEKLTFHHLIGGLHEEGNLVPLCEECHKKVHKADAERTGKAITSGIRSGIKGILYSKFEKGRITIIDGNRTEKKAEDNMQVLRNKFADLQKEIRKEFQRLEKELKEKDKEDKDGKK